ncbi:MAG: M48 family metallopeptidase [Acidimicrobiia bacterium]|nr:M48 family metallopeptidase [Acidimicrobiia bacterium]NNC43702.1 M48 family metallopeptidase [Acidimicrobiia bacterium]NNL48202.1 M48 family metallopeptidase [Acidimicrobiia bacterium]
MTVMLPEISPVAWEHPTDRAALNALRKIPGFDSLLRKVVGMFAERNFRMLFKASAIKVGPNQYRDIHELLTEVCSTLDTDVPQLYISQTPVVNAGAYGMDDPFIILNSSLIEISSPTEVKAVLGHEVGHIMSDHALYRTMLYILLQLVASRSPLVGSAMLPILLALLEWSRKAEVSCDRAGLLAVQDLDASLGILANMAGGMRGRDDVNLAAFVEQSDEYRDSSGLDSYFKVMATLGQTHPFAVVRVAELRNWVDEGVYDSILAGAYARRGEEPPQSYLADIADASSLYSERAVGVFENTEKYVNKALSSFLEAWQSTMGSDDKSSG